MGINYLRKIKIGEHNYRKSLIVGISLISFGVVLCSFQPVAKSSDQTSGLQQSTSSITDSAISSESEVSLNKQDDTSVSTAESTSNVSSSIPAIDDKNTQSSSVSNDSGYSVVVKAKSSDATSATSGSVCNSSTKQTTETNTNSRVSQENITAPSTQNQGVLDEASITGDHLDVSG